MSYEYENYDSLSGHVLVLNQSYEPLTICSPKKALVLIYLMKADLVEYVEGRIVHTVNQNFPFPSVIRINRYIRVPFRKIEISRKNIIKRDANQCQYCGSNEFLTVDHVIPKSRGGGANWENLVCACKSCNSAKGNKTPEEAEMKLMSVPKKPNFIVFLKSKIGNVDEKWKQFMFY